MADVPEHEQGKTETKRDLTSELPVVESPSISPAVTEPAAEPPPTVAATTAAATTPSEREPPEATTAPVASSELAAPEVSTAPRFRFNARHKRYALLAASVVFAAALGVVVGAVASGGLTAPRQTEFAGVENSKATQQTIARLSNEIAVLKASVEAANKAAHAQIAKVTDKPSERPSRDSVEVTGSISAPQTVTPLPAPRPASRVVADWSIRDVRDGYVLVQGHGEIYQVSIGAPLPGLGAVTQVKRQDGRWVVVTPKGIIVSLRDRRYFD